MGDFQLDANRDSQRMGPNREAIGPPGRKVFPFFNIHRIRRAIKSLQPLIDLRPKGIILMLDLLRPIYRKTAAYGHFGREEPEFTWEKTDKAAALKAAAGA